MPLARKLVLHYIQTKFKVLSSLSKRTAAEKAFQLFCTPQQRNKKKLPLIFEKAEPLQFSFENATVRGYRWGKGNEKKALILHGFESSVINFDKYVKPLIKKGYEVLAFDAPAHGRSSGKSIDILIYKKMVAQIHKHYGPVDSFIAHSFGGLALSLFLEETPHNECTRAVLIAPAVETVRAADNFFRLLQLDEEVRKEFDNIIEKKSGHSTDWFSIKRAAHHIKAQVLFLQDKEDELTPYSDVVPIIQANHPNFQFIISEGLGHRKIYKDNHTQNAIIDFL